MKLTAKELETKLATIIHSCVNLQQVIVCYELYNRLSKHLPYEACVGIGRLLEYKEGYINLSEKEQDEAFGIKAAILQQEITE